jgi:hypothetical protein
MDCKPPFRFLDGIRSELLRREVKEWPPQDMERIVFERGITGRRRIFLLGKREYNAMPREKSIRIFSPFLLCAYLGHGEYVRWKYLSDPMILDSNLKCGFLMTVIAIGRRLDALCVAQHLLDRGLNPPTVIHSGCTGLFGSGWRREWTFWQRFIFCICYADKAHSAPKHWNLVGRLI